MVNFYKEFKQSMAGTPYVLAKTLKEDFPQVERAINVRFLRGFKLKMGEEYIDVRHPLATDSEVFDIFTIPIKGSLLSEDPLQELNSIVISQSLADLFFPEEEDPVSQEVVGLINNKEQVLVVSGVYEDIPKNSTFQADCFLNGKWTLEPLNQTFGVSDMDVSWRWDFWNTWVLLSEDTDVSEIEGQFDAFEKKHISEDPHVHYSLQSLPDVYLKSIDISKSGISGDMKNIRLFSTVALLILIIAAINYIILSVAVSTGRAKEIGIRKTAGASVARIRNQVLSEALILSLLVLPVALLFMWLAKPAAETLFRTSLEVLRSNVIVYILLSVADHCNRACIRSLRLVLSF